MSGFSLAARFPKASKAFYEANADLAVPVAAGEPTKPVSSRSPLAIKFESTWSVLDPAPEYVAEHPVCSDRKWRLDYWWPCGVFLELQGGIYLAGKGGHVAPKRFINDCEKWNRCSLNGWTGWKLATGMVTPDNVLALRDFVLSRMK